MHNSNSLINKAFGFAVVASKDYHGSGYPPEWLQTDGVCQSHLSCS